MSQTRIANTALRSKLMSASEAAALVADGSTVATSGFTGAGYPKVLPAAIAQRFSARGSGKINLWTGASTAPELDSVLAEANAINQRLPYQSDPQARKRINAGDIHYIDMHLSNAAQYAAYGFLGRIDTAIIEVAGILEDGSLIPSSSVGNNVTWLAMADQVILEVNQKQSALLEGMHDIVQLPNPPHRQPIPIVSPGDRIGSPYLRVDLNKVKAVVETNASDRNSPFTAPDENSQRIAAHILNFFEHEVRHGRLPKNLLPLQSGVGNVANAVMSGLNEGGFENLTSYTEVIQDGMLQMIRSGKLIFASATAFSLSPAALIELEANFSSYAKSIILRPQEISNSPEVIRRLGVLAMNGIIEADIYGNVNSTHIAGTSMMNGIGGSGDFARNAFISLFMTPSTAKNGTLSCIVPFVSHVDHTEHDVQVLVTEQGLADLRGLAPRQRARVIIENCAHPDFKPLLREYFERASNAPGGHHTPHLLDEALTFLNKK